MLKFTEKKQIENKLICTTFYFFKENDNLYSFIDEALKDLDFKALSNIIKSQNINRIGYFQYELSENRFVKIYILPKTVPDLNLFSKTELKEIFTKYFKEYLRLKNIYPDKKSGTLIQTDNIVDLDFTSIDSIEDYIVKKYIKSLNELILFFKSFSIKEHEKLFFNSQSISGNIDVKRNIFEVDKSIIHQYNIVEINNSDLAIIVLSAIKIFKRKYLYFRNSSLKYQIKKIETLLKKILLNNYRIENYTYSLQEILNKINTNRFKSSKKLIQFRNNILNIMSWESWNESKSINSEIVWFSAEYMFELSLYEKLLSLKDDHDFKFKEQISKKFSIIVDGAEVGHKLSIPDFLVETRSFNFVIDAKWKVLNSFNDILSSDIFKGLRDCLIHYPEVNYRLVLIYPKINMNRDNFYKKPINFSYDSSSSFEILEVPIFNSNSLKQFLIV